MGKVDFYKVIHRKTGVFGTKREEIPLKSFLGELSTPKVIHKIRFGWVDNPVLSTFSVDKCEKRGGAYIYNFIFRQRSTGVLCFRQDFEKEAEKVIHNFLDLTATI